MTGKGNEISLFRRLRDAQIECPLNEQQRFLPLSIIDKVITEDIVKQELPGKLSLLFDRKLPGKIVKEAKKTFAILVEIGEPVMIKELYLDGLRDEHLPLSHVGNSNELVSHKGKKFPSFAKWKTEQRVLDFVDKQWIVLAPVLDSTGNHIDLASKCPLPFLEMDGVGSTHTSTVFRSELHQAHFKPRGQEKQCRQVATKEIRDEKTFKQEKANLDTIQKLKHDHLVRHFATYQKGTLYYVIFPWANGGNLRDFWERQDTHPRDTTLTMWSLRQMLGLAKALEALHGENCRHGDLKPENILHFHESTDTAIEGNLVIADVGISKTHQSDTQFRHVGTSTRATTPSYEAPEAITNHAPRSRRYDMWSIGCIFLEFAVWMLHDVETIDAFCKARDGPFHVFNHPRVAEIHPMVNFTMKKLRQDPRCSGDTIFGRLIDIIGEGLLQIDVDQRIWASELVEKLQKSFQDMETDPGRLFNTVSSPPEKLHFPRRVGTGATDSLEGKIPE